MYLCVAREGELNYGSSGGRGGIWKCQVSRVIARPEANIGEIIGRKRYETNRILSCSLSAFLHVVFSERASADACRTNTNGRSHEDGW